MQGTPHEVENIPPKKDEQAEQENGEEQQETAGAPEAPTGATPGASEEII